MPKPDHKNTTPKVKKEVVQDAVEEYSESNDKEEETVLSSYAQLLKANRFINISVHGGAKRKESGSFGGMGCLNLASDAYKLMTHLYPARPATTKVLFLLTSVPTQLTINICGSKIRMLPQKHARPYQIPQALAPKVLYVPRIRVLYHWIWSARSPFLSELNTDRFTLDNWKCYLDSCATYHNLFVRDFLDRLY